MKKLTLKAQIKELTADLASARAYAKRFEDELQGIKQLFPSSGFGSKSDIKGEIIDLVAYKRGNEGSINAGREAAQAMKEIVRWLVNPKTAEQSKELEEIRKRHGYLS